mgnify:CR=1 FL=1|jgi:hypothetical protein|tara:strand:- start:99 stop:470 length:372 start_codon:yes stop_codon:yes gene_type:complete
MSKKALTNPLGKIPAENEKEFKNIVNAVIKQWGLTRPVDVMTANRMVSTWMKMRYVESCLKKYGLFFEDYDKEGKVNRLRVNELAYYLKQLENDFRSYYRLLNVKRDNSDKPETFLEMIGGEE